VERIIPCMHDYSDWEQTLTKENDYLAESIFYNRIDTKDDTAYASHPAVVSL
jgi:hypothetical protein